MTDLKQVGRYEIKTEIGRGGMAAVYLAHDPLFKRDVAVKILPRQYTHDPMFRARFDREAQTIAGLEHPAIVPVYDFGEESGQPFLIMRYMPGDSLADKLAKGALPLAQAVAILERIASALDRAHSQGIVHRDLKPGNILFDQYGDAFLADFGIAKMAEATAALTGSSIIGTPAYMSPEQVKGSDVDGRSDIYALGVILFEMSTGQQPFEAKTPIAVAFKHVHEPVPDIRARKANLSLDLQFVINQAMSKEPDERFQTANDLAKSAKTTLLYATDEFSKTPRPYIEPIPHKTPPPISQPTPQKTPVDVSLAMPQARQAAESASSDDGKRKIPLWIWVITAVIALLALSWGGFTFFDNRNGAIADEANRNGTETAIAGVITDTVSTETPTLPPTATATATIPPTPTETATTAPTETATIAPTEPPPTATICPAPQLRVSIGSINIRSGPGSNYAIVTIALENNTFPIIARTNNLSWYNVDLGEDNRGWISATVVELITIACNQDISVAATIPSPPLPTNTPIPPTSPPAATQPPTSGGGGGSSPAATQAPPTTIPP